MCCHYTKTTIWRPLEISDCGGRYCTIHRVSSNPLQIASSICAGGNPNSSLRESRTTREVAVCCNAALLPLPSRSAGNYRHGSPPFKKLWLPLLDLNQRPIGYRPIALPPELSGITVGRGAWARTRTPRFKGECSPIELHPNWCLPSVSIGALRFFRPALSPDQLERLCDWRDVPGSNRRPADRQSAALPLS
jgi:hypothetical protein